MLVALMRNHSKNSPQELPHCNVKEIYLPKQILNKFLELKLVKILVAVVLAIS